MKYADNVDACSDIVLDMMDSESEALNILEHGVTMATTYTEYDKKTQETKNIKITYEKYYTHITYKYYRDDIEKQLSPLNSYCYTLTLHEMLHAMGIGHNEDETSIMYPYSRDDIIDFSQSDLTMIEKYNQVFYGKTKQAPESQELNESEEMVF